MHRSLIGFVALTCVGLSGGRVFAADIAHDGPLPERVQFNRDIRPILSENCFACHGFDQKKRKADLRLDTRAGLTHKIDAGVPVVAGKPAESLVYQRVMTADAEEIMPPPASKKTLTERQKSLLKKWIEQGAAWEDHWSFVPVARPAVPQAGDGNWVRNPIDAFVLERLKKEGLAPSPEADKTTLIRRLTLDLTGLPPTTKDVDDFLADNAPDAYEKVVDRLLSSVRYGERMAMDWLDAARYADTHGYHIDAGRDMTRWREWVINAFHTNKPYDQFTVEQLAGDLLPNATLEQKVASGFNRNHMVNFEGGAIAEEYRTAYVLDRVNTTGTVFLGLSVACTQCHDHKYDPITQKEYYQLYAFFNTIDERGLDGSKGNAAPMVSAPTAEQQKALEALSARVAAAERKLAGPLADADAAQAEWEASLPAESKTKLTWTAADAVDMKSAGRATLTQQADKSILATDRNPAKETYTVTLAIPAGLKKVTGVRLEALPDKSLAAGGPGRSPNGNMVMTDFTVGVSRGEKASPAPVKIAKAVASFAQDTFPIDNAIDANPTSGWAIYPEVGKAHEAVFELAEPVGSALADAANAPRPQLVIKLAFNTTFGQHQLGKFRLSLTDAPSPTKAGNTPANVAAILASPSEKRSEPQRNALRDYFRQSVWAGGKAVVAEIAEAKKARDELVASVPTSMVMQEMANPRDTFILMRGEYDKPGEKVTPGLPAFLPPLPKDQPMNRLGFARWLIDRQHPLTSRVTVNRYWQMVFGVGLVKTSEDFGSQGELPSHPELLDWLAAEFIETGWDVRRLMRTYVTSSTYRQRSAVTPELHGRDPENRLLARGSRYRLQAEVIRDQALAASGLLNGKVGGQSVSPYQPAGLWEELMSRGDGAKWSAQVYVQSKGEDLYRRTMYTFWKRTSPPPTLSTFDAPDRETCTVRRGRTNTPLQALILMNDPTYVEASRKLAERLMSEPPATASDADRITFAFRQVLGRSPKDAEAAVLKSVIDKQRAKFAADLPAAAKLLSVGESGRNEKLNPADLAAWATMCSVILNLDEAVTRG
ncbi:PSD1 and planctomycete cytochrome C domain-containing protein [Humisphaera borealis]|uniref:PSD1 domain-containing protein n=1 Tax=Humisphaera borealis TaxID=2807512 RepID=A0A7M2X394_9BACT|nr:PSD1 and planctomycete cytochrome C domain-containing protein [Humisphaera borealis]QOV92236.1 PSD1 domain-containing protein [Humisphaera borealis]